MSNIHNACNFVSVYPFWNFVPKSKLTYIDLFCGCGGLSLGLSLSGLNGVLGLDFFKEACDSYNRNLDHPCINGDINLQETKDRIYETIGDRHINVVAGGFPCQGFSMSGRRDVEDSRNTLYLEMLNIVERLRPEAVIGENVVGILSMKGTDASRQRYFNVIDAIISDYSSIGYEMTATVLNAANYFVPQRRERVIFIARRMDVGDWNSKVYHPAPIIAPRQHITVDEAIADIENVPPFVGKEFQHVPAKHSDEMVERIKKTPQGSSVYDNYSETMWRCIGDAPALTIKSNHGSTHVHPRLNRCLTVREMARLQAFPDDFHFCGPKQQVMTQIGNAVPPLLGKAIGLSTRITIGDIKAYGV